MNCLTGLLLRSLVAPLKRGRRITMTMIKPIMNKTTTMITTITTMMIMMMMTMITVMTI